MRARQPNTNGATSPGRNPMPDIPEMFERELDAEAIDALSADDINALTTAMNDGMDRVSPTAKANAAAIIARRGTALATDMSWRVRENGRRRTAGRELLPPLEGAEAEHRYEATKHYDASWDDWRREHLGDATADRHIAKREGEEKDRHIAELEAEIAKLQGTVERSAASERAAVRAADAAFRRAKAVEDKAKAAGVRL